MELKILPETFEGCQAEELLKVWQEIKSKEGTNAPREKIKTMGNFLREYKLGLFGVAKSPAKNIPDGNSGKDEYESRLQKSHRDFIHRI